MSTIPCLSLTEELLNNSYSNIFGMDPYSESLLNSFVEDIKGKINEGSEPIGIDSPVFKTLSDYLSDVLEDEVDKKTLDSLILKMWNEKPNASRSTINTDKTEDLELQEVPNLTKGLSDIFNNEVDWRNFLQSSKRSIILATIVNPEDNLPIINNYNLNNSLISLQEQLASKLRSQFDIQLGPIYKNGIFNKDNYDNLIKIVSNKFTPYLTNGKYDFQGSSRIRDAFNNYLLLTNFDNYLTKFLGKVISIDPNLVNVRQLPINGLKYIQDGESIKQEWDDEKAGDMRLNTSSYVRDYITSLREINQDGIELNRYVLTNEFNNLITFIKDTIDLATLANVRDYPDIALKEIFDRIAENPKSYFKGKYAILEGTFRTLYNNIFNLNTNSLYSTYIQSNTSKKNDLYSMICSQIGKTASVAYIQTYYDTKDGSRTYKTDFLTSEAIDANRSELNRTVALGIATESLNPLLNRFHVQFLDANRKKSDNKIKYVKFKAGTYDVEVNLLDSSIDITQDGQEVQSLPTNTIKGLINSITRRSYNTEFYETILKSATKDEKNGLVRYVGNTFLATKLAGLEKSSISNLVLFDLDNSSYNQELHVLRPEGFNKALAGVKLLARAISYENKESSKSYVKNSLGASLSKTSLTSLGMEDYIQFSKNRKVANELGTSHPLYYNLFTNADLNKHPINLANFFKTEVVNFEGDTKQIKEMSAADLAYEAFVFGYLINKGAPNKDNPGRGFIQVQSNQYSDKSKISGKLISLYNNIVYTGNNFSIDKPIAEMTDSELSNLYYNSVGMQMQKLSGILKRDYDTLFGILHDLYGDKFETYDTLNEYKDQLNKLNDTNIHEALLAAKQQGIKLEIIPEIHYTKDGKKKKFNELLDYFMNGVFANPEVFRNRMLQLDRDYAESLRSLNVVFDTKFDNGSDNKAITKNIDINVDQEEYISSTLGKEAFNKISKYFGGNTYGNIWVSPAGQLRNYIALDKEGNIIDDSSISLKDSDKVRSIVINPDLHRFRLINNLISDNYNLSITGMSFLHPAKVKAKSWKDIGLEEGARTVSYNKRGVIHGATIHPYVKNKKDGIPQYFNLSVIQDLEAINMGLIGDNGEATPADGAIFRTGSIAIWEKNSLPELKASFYQSKPIGYSYNYNHLSSTLLKCAMFTISNAVVRNSITNRIKMDNILRNMMDNPWLVPNLDLTSELEGREFYYTNPEQSLSNYFVLSNISKVSTNIHNNTIDNIYQGTITEYNPTTGIVNSSVRTFSINSNYDLYKILGGAYSGYINNNGQFVYDESSWDVLAEIGNNINIDSNSPEIEEYNSFIDSGELIGKKRIEIPEDIEIEDIRVLVDGYVIPTKYLKLNSGNVPYFQPMKYSDTHYLANSSAVKNGMANVNPASLYYNSVASRIKPTDKWIFAYPTTGKTQASKMGYNIMSFDDTYSKDLEAYRNATDPIEKGQLKGKLIQDIAEANKSGKQVYFSDPEVLETLSLAGIQLDKVISLSLEDYIQRERNRGSQLSDEELLDKYNTITNTLSSTFNSIETINADGHQLYEYLGGSLTSIELDPDYIGLQLIAEHDIEDDEISEMTQVISALMQNTYTADLALTVLRDIGDNIANELDLYNKWDISTPEGRAEVNRILGKALVRTFANREGQEISLASAYLDNIKDELFNSNIPAELIPNIPFDDNNILGMFETSFANGFNKDIIKRKFPGMAAVLNPSQDVFTLYDYNGQTITSADFAKMGIREQINTLKDLLAKLDVEIPVSEIREGDWVEINGKVKQVGILNKVTSDGITLREIRKMRGQNIKKLGSRGRNLRAQNYKMRVLEPEKINTPDINFDLFDLDIIMFSHNLDRFMNLQKRVNDGEELLDNDLLDYEEYSNTFNELRSYIDSIYYKENGTPIAKWDSYLRNWNKEGKPINKRLHEEFKRYITEYIQYEMKNLSEGKLHVPRDYRLSDEYVQVEGEYTPNELAVGKPWATKFLLDVGDNLADVNEDFFIKKLEARRNSIIPKELTNFYFCANNYTLNFGNEELIQTLKDQGYKVEPIDNELDIIANQNGTVRRVNSEVYYPVNSNMKFYRITDTSGKSTEMVTGYTLEDAVDIWNSKSFYTNTINYPTTGEIEAKELVKFLTLDSDINGLEVDFDSKAGIEQSYRNAIRVANKIEADESKQAQKMYISFQEALRAIAARIPAQSMQSFMNMKIVGFTEVDSNLAYVPVNMLIYEGSMKF